MKKIGSLLIFLTLAVLSHAQQLPLYSQYMLNDYVMNPAIAGSNPYYECKSNNRYQWVGITDAPRTYIMSINGQIKGRPVGIGGSVFTDITGPTRRTGINLSYAYHLKLNDEVKLGLGLSAGVLQYAVDASKINTHDINDIAISTSLQSTTVPDFGFGTYLYSDKFYFGVAAPQIYPSRLDFFDYKSKSKIVTHIYATGGYKYKINDAFVLQPTALIKFVSPAPIQIDLGARMIYQEKVWLGAGYRTKDALSALVGYTYQNNITIGFSYDFTTTNVRKYSSGTSELYFAIKFYNPDKK